jgi:methionyl-tRNA formyltransferase
MQRDHTDQLRVVFMGTPGFSVPALNALLKSEHQLVGVVTQPNRQKGRGKKTSAPPVKEAILGHEIPVFQPEEINTSEALAQLTEWTPDVIVVTAYGQILSSDILELPPHGCINIHASLLPKYRGAAPINWAIINGETETGISIMKMDEGMDTGPVFERQRIDIAEDTTAQQLHDRLAELGAEMIPDSLTKIVNGQLEAVPQDDSEATYAPMLSKEDGRIDWTKSAKQIVDHVRGVHPWPGAFSFHGEQTDANRIKFHRLQRSSQSRLADGDPGEVLAADASGDQLEICTGDGAVRAVKLQAPGRQAMGTTDFLNGYEIETGDRFV